MISFSHYKRYFNVLNIPNPLHIDLMDRVVVVLESLRPEKGSSFGSGEEAERNVLADKITFIKNICSS